MPLGTKDPEARVVNILRDGTVKIGGAVLPEAALFKLGDRPSMLVRADGSCDFESVQKVMMAASRNGRLKRVMFVTTRDKGM